MSEKVENTESVESKNEATPNKMDIWKTFNNVDPETGLEYEWLEVRDYLCEHGPAKALDKLYSYYLTKFTRMDPWSVYLLTCSHFTMEELEGTPINRSYRRRLEAKVMKLMKKRDKDSSSSFPEFLRKNAAEFEV